MPSPYLIASYGFNFGRGKRLEGGPAGHYTGPWLGTTAWYYSPVKRKHQKTLEAIFARPTSANIRWADIEALLVSFGAKIDEKREDSRIAVVLEGQVAVFHRPHPEPTTDKGAVASVRKWLEALGHTP